MYNRRGPSKGTPATVKCQKCLKYGHYSYECKANVQERPYVARPSRTQQLSNPKLVPKLTEAAPPKLQKKEGVADQQLAKLEAERARKRELDQDDTKSNAGNSPPRGRSPSYDSVSTVSTSRSLSRSPGPSARGRRHESKSPSPMHQHSQRSAYSSRDDYNAARSPSSIQSGSGVHSRPFLTRGTASPEHGLAHANERSRRDHEDAAYSARGPHLGDSKRHSSSISRSPPPSRQPRYRSRSAHQRKADDYSEAQHQGRNLERGAASRDVRKRSMSPFSKRLALTKSMQDGQ